MLGLDRRACSYLNVTITTDMCVKILGSKPEQIFQWSNIIAKTESVHLILFLNFRYVANVKLQQFSIALSTKIRPRYRPFVCIAFRHIPVPTFDMFACT